MQLDGLVAVARFAGILGAVFLGVAAVSAGLRGRGRGALVWSVVAAVAFGGAAWVEVSARRVVTDIWLELAAPWFVPALVLASMARRLHGWALATGVAGTVAAVLHQPFWDPMCSGACGPDAALVAVDPRFSYLAGALVALVTAGLGLAVVRQAPLAGVGAAAGLFWAMQRWTSTPAPVRDGVVLVLAVAAMVAAVAAWQSAARAAKAVAALRALGEPDPAPVDRATLDRRIALLTGDPTAQVVFPGEGPESVDRAAAAVTRDGSTVALIESRAPLNVDELASALTPAIRAGIDNERLRGEISREVAELEASRARIIDAATAERRRLERNVHDGAQQVLVALLAELGLARAAGDTHAGRAADETRAVLEELRALSRGLASPVLDGAGLATALASLADGTNARLVVEGEFDLDHLAAHDAYSIVALAAATVDRLGLAELRVRVDRSASDLRIRFAPEAAMDSTLRARVDALGGRVSWAAGAWEVSLPCA